MNIFYEHKNTSDMKRNFMQSKIVKQLSIAHYPLSIVNCTLLIVFCLFFGGKAWGQSTLTVYGDNTTTNEYVPIYGYYADEISLSQFIIPSSDLSGMASGSIISKLTFYSSNENVSWGNAKFEVYMTEVSYTVFSSANMTWVGKVKNANSLQINNYQMIVELDDPYIYMGGNLLIGVKETSSGSWVRAYWYGVNKNAYTAIGNEENSGSSYEQKQFLPKTTFTYTIPTTPFVTLSPSSATVLTGFTQSLTATYGNVSGTPTITYTSSNTSVATVSGSGTTATVTAVAPGTATITATMNGSYTATCAITVEDPSYCEPSFSNPSDDYISKFATSGGTTNINNTSTYVSSGYSDYYNNNSVSIEAGATLTCTVTSSSTQWNYGHAIWVDWNKDYEFTSEERVAYTSSTATGNWTGSFVVPANIAAGDYRMRVIHLYNDTPTDPCMSDSYGEAEDYKLTVVSGASSCTKTITYTYGFEDASDFDCWKTIDCEEDISQGISGIFENYYVGVESHNGSKFFAFSSFNGNTDPQYLISPELSGIVNGLHVEFYYANVNAAPETFYVGYSTTNSNVSSFTWGSVNTNTSLDYTRFSVNYPANTKYVAVKYTTADSYYLLLDDFTFEEASSCLEPTNITASNISTIGARISWTAGASETSWDIFYTTNPSTVPTSGTTPSVSGTSSNPYNLTGLDPASTYYLYVRAVCSGSDKSDWSSPCTFNTDCNAMSLPYTNTFETGALTVCWTVLNESPIYMDAGVAATSAYAGSYHLDLRRGTTSGAQIIVLPEVSSSYALNDDYEVSFYAMLSGSNGSASGRTLAVGVMTDPNDPSTFVQVGSTISPTDTYAKYSVMLSDYSGSGHYIAIQHYSTDNGHTFIDNLEVKQSSYTIAVSADPAAGGTVSGGGTYTYGESCTISATANSGYQFVNWTRNGTQVSSNANYTFNVTGSATYVANFSCIAPTNLVVDDITPNGATLTWSGTGSVCDVQLGQASATSTTVQILTEGFESGSLPSGWTQEGDDEMWEIGAGDNTSSDVYSGSYNAKTLESEGNGTISYLITPVLDLSSYINAKLTCWYMNNIWISDIDEFGVYYRTSSTSDWVELFNTTEDHDSWTQTDELALPSRSYVQIGFKYVDNYGYGIGLDEIIIEANTTEFNWNTVSSDVTSPYTISNLDPESNYSVRVIDNCGNQSNEVEFITLPCLVPTDIAANNITTNSATLTWAGVSDSYNIRYGKGIVEDFETGSLPDGWSQEGDGTWSVGVGNDTDDDGTVTAAHNGSYNVKATHGNSGNMTYLIMPAMDLSQASSATISLWYTNETWPNDTDGFGIYYRVNGGSWNELFYTNTQHKRWTHIENLALTGLAANYEIGFLYEDNYGYGVTIDDIIIVVNPTTVANATTSYNFTGLETGTVYVEQVQGSCGGTLTDWSEPYGFSTLCNIAATVSPSGTGSVTGTGNYSRGNTCTLTATADDCYNFVNWTENGTPVSTNATYSFTVTGNRTLVANFTLNSHTVTVDAGEGGSASQDGNGTYTCGSTARLTATPDACHNFSYWTDGNGGTFAGFNPIEFTVDHDITFTAHFTLKTYTVTTSASPSTGGSVTGGGTVNCGENATLTATPSTNYCFKNWTEGGSVVSTDASYTFTVTGARTLVANFTHYLEVSDIATVDYCVTGAHAAVSATPAAGSGDYTYTWQKYNGSSWVAAPDASNSDRYTPPYTTTGTVSYRVSVADNNGCAGHNSVVKEFDVEVSDVPSITALSAPAKCSGEELTILPTVNNNGKDVSSESYQISSDLSSWSTFANGSAVTDDKNGYYIKYTATNGCGSSSQTVQITVNSSPTASIEGTNPLPVCILTQVTLNASGAGDGGSYAWDNELGSGASKTITVTEAKNYTVTVTDANTCTARATKSVTIKIPGNLPSTYSPEPGIIWTGYESTDWDDQRNWLFFNGDNYTPIVEDLDSTLSVVLRTGGTEQCILHDPVINNPEFDANAGMTVRRNITVANGTELNIGGALTLEGGTLTLGGSTYLAVGDTVLIANGASVSFSASDTLVVNGNFTLSGNINFVDQGLTDNEDAVDDPTDALVIGGDLTINGASTFSPAGGSIVFARNSGNRRVYNNTGRPLEFFKVELDDERTRSGVPHTVFPDGTIIKYTAIFSYGIWDGDLIFAKTGNALVKGGFESYASGNITKIGKNKSFSFPTGGNDVLGSIAAKIPTDVQVSAKFNSKTGGYDQEHDGYPRWWNNNDMCDDSKDLNHVSNYEYWTVRANTTTTLTDLTFTAEAADRSSHFNPASSEDEAVNEEAIRLAMYNGCWKNLGGADNVIVDDGKIEIEIPALSLVASGAKGIADDPIITLGSTTKTTILPIELTSITATCDGHSALVEWSTASERNNDYFSLERSDDAINFSEIARVAGAGNSIEPLDYSYTDYGIHGGDNYYRLVQVDYDGTSTVSEIVVANCIESDVEEPEVQAYPNPFNGELTLVLDNFDNRPATIEVYDMLGKLIYIQKASAPQNSYETILNLSNLPSGAYTVRVSTTDFVINKNVVKN